MARVASAAGGTALAAATRSLAALRPAAKPLHPVGLGEWHPFAALRLSDDAHDQEVSFDPVRHQLPGLTQYPWVRRLREPAYLSARRSRRP